MHVRRAQYGTFQINILYITCIFCTYKVWCQLTHLHKGWSCSMAYYWPNASTFKVFLTHQVVYYNTLWRDCIYVRIFPDGKLFTCIMLYINTVQCYWRVVCNDRKFIPSITFLIRFYLTDYQEESLYRFPSWQACTNCCKHKTCI